MTASRSRAVLRVWSLGLALSALLAAAGERWPEPLPIRPTLVWILVLLPPLAMVLVLIAGWALPPQEGESSDTDRENS
jgi:hypothetical protein